MYEVIDTDERDERGIYFDRRADAIHCAEVTPYCAEVWQLADDEAETRALLIGRYGC